MTWQADGEGRQMTDWYLPPSDEVRQIVDKQYPAEDRLAIIDALATILSESTRETILILAYGDTARLMRLVGARELGLPGLLTDAEDNLEEPVKRFIAAELLFPYRQLLPTTRLNIRSGPVRYRRTEVHGVIR